METDTPAAAEIAIDLVDFEVLASWMDVNGLGPGPIQNIEELTGGTQNVLIRFTRGGTDYVLRRPPRHLRKASNEVLRREARVLAALGDTPVRSPRVFAACGDETVMGAVFYLMESIDGFNASLGLPEPHSSDKAIRRRMGFEAVDALATLGAVDHETIGLADFGKPDGFLERQVPRWLAELDKYTELDGYAGPDIPGLDVIAGWLEDNRPASFRPGIMHGDYHLANLMFSHSGSELAAIVDWEMCTIGDPLLDLGWLLVTWPDPNRPVSPALALSSFNGFPQIEELAGRYAQQSDRDLTALDWYRVLAAFKLGIILEGTHARACAGRAPVATGDLLHAITLSLFEQAHEII